MRQRNGPTRRDAIIGSATLASWLVSASQAAGAPQGRDCLRIGLIGAPAISGEWSETLAAGAAEAMRELRLCVSHIWDADTRLAAEYGRVKSVPNVVDRFDQMASKVDGIIVNDPRAVAWHPRLVLPYLRVGTPVWIDGPFAYSMADARKMIEAAAVGRTAIVAATAEEFLPLTGWLRRKAGELAPLTAAMVVVSTHGRPAHKWAGVEGVNLGCAVFGPNVRKVCRVAASAKEPAYVLTLEYGDLPGDHPLHVVVHGAASETDRVWARLYGSDMCEGRQAFSDDRSEDWLGTFVPAALAVQRTFTSKLSPQAPDYLLEKTKLCLACYKSSLVPDGKQLSVKELEDDWVAENPYPGSLVSKTAS